MNGSALQRISDDIPRISNPLGLAAMGIATLGVGAALTRLRPSDREGRSQRFARMIEARLRSTLEKQVVRGEYGNVNSAPWDVDRCEVQVNEGFGKPTVVCFTVVMTSCSEELAEDLRAHAAQGGVIPKLRRLSLKESFSAVMRTSSTCALWATLPCRYAPKSSLNAWGHPHLIVAGSRSKPALLCADPIDHIWCITRVGLRSELHESLLLVFG